jgi:hypothetical protein
MNWLREWWVFIAICAALVAFFAWFIYDRSQDVDEAKQSVETIEIEGCEYLLMKSTTYYGYSVVAITHKGNCKNPIHQP